MPRSMPGHGRVSVRYPPPRVTTPPPSSTTSADTPGSGNVAEPGLVTVAPGKGLIMIPPVSVCHHVSTTGQVPPPMCSRYHIHASGLIGSPTEPITPRLDRSCLAGSSDPHFMNVRIAVGAVYSTVTPYFSTIAQKRSLPGKLGTPSYITVLAPLASGP